MRPLQAKATFLGSNRALIEDQERLNAAAMLSATREHDAYLRSIRGDSRPPPPAHTTVHPAAPATLAALPAPAALQWRHVAAVAPPSMGRNDRAPSPTARNDQAP